MDQRFLERDAVFLLHFRKCGGSSLRQLLSEICATSGKQFDTLEGWTLDHERPLPQPDQAYRVAVLREPLARIRSSYKYEGRWPQSAPIRTAETATPFTEWVETLLAAPPSNWLWVCAENYFLKTLIGYPEVGRDAMGRTELRTAKRMLRTFDLVLVTSRLSDPDTGRLLSRRFGKRIEMPHQVFPTAAESPSEADEDLFDDAILAELAERNRLDTMLYHYAAELFEEQVADLEVR